MMFMLSLNNKFHLIKYRLFVVAFFLVTGIYYSNGLSLSSSTKREERSIKPVKPVKPTPQQYVLSGFPGSAGSFFRHLQTTVEQDLSSSSEASKQPRTTTQSQSDPDKASQERKPKQKGRYVHAPVGYEKRYSTCKSEVESLRSQIESLVSELSMKDEKLKQLESRPTKDDCRSLQKEKKELKKKEKKLTQREDELKMDENRIKTRDSEVRQLEEQVLKSKTLYDLKLSELKQREEGIAEIESAAKQLDALKIEHDAATDAARDLSEKLASLNSEMVKLNNEKEELARQLEIVVNESNSYRAIIEDLKNELAQTRKLLDECLEEKNSAFAQMHRQEKTAGRGEDRKSTFNKVLAQLKEMQDKGKGTWIKAAPRRTSQKEPEKKPFNEIQYVFNELEKLREQEFQSFVAENGLQDMTPEEQLKKFEDYKANNMSPGTYTIPRFVKSEN